jgi:Rrf2 family iron-sulfur cluster assembly transcriptional regulator
MRVTRWGEYGILCSLYLARNHDHGAVGAAEIAESQGIPLQYTQQILHRLRKGGVIASVRGPHGGYRLTKSPQETNLKEILYAAEGDTLELICDSNPVYGSCHEADRSCSLRDVWHDLKVSIDEMLTSRTLATLLAKQIVLPGEQLVPGPQRSTKSIPPAA